MHHFPLKTYCDYDIFELHTQRLIRIPSSVDPFIFSEQISQSIIIIIIIIKFQMAKTQWRDQEIDVKKVKMTNQEIKVLKRIDLQLE
jgi:hypothetical protein